MTIRFKHKPGLVVYLTAGDPSVEATRAIALEAIDAGADVIELGVPFRRIIGRRSCCSASKRARGSSRNLTQACAETGWGNSRTAAGCGPRDLQLSESDFALWSFSIRRRCQIRGCGRSACDGHDCRGGRRVSRPVRYPLVLRQFFWPLPQAPTKGLRR